MKDKKLGIAVGLDIGTTKIVAIVGRRDEHGKVEILGVGKAPSLGVHRGVVNNIMQTIDSIQKAVKQAEESSGHQITSVTVGIAGQHIHSLQHSDYIIREEVDEVISEEDISNLIDQVKRLHMAPGDEIIHVLPQEYKVDGEPGIKQPVGMYGNRLEANFHVVVGQISLIKNIIKCVKNSGLKLDDITLEPLASAEAVLSDEEKEAGVALIDIGGGTTDLAIIKDHIIKHTAVTPYGGNIITNDIKEGCSIINKHAEQLKKQYGSAWPTENRENQIVSVPGVGGREPREISFKRLSQIIHSRVIEIFEKVFAEIKAYGYDEQKNKLIAGVIITGGGANLKDLKILAEHVMGIDVKIGFPNEHLSETTDLSLLKPEYSTAVGLLLKSFDNMVTEENLDIEEEKIEGMKTQASSQIANGNYSAYTDHSNLLEDEIDTITENKQETIENKENLEASKSPKKRASIFKYFTDKLIQVISDSE